MEVTVIEVLLSLTGNMHTLQQQLTSISQDQEIPVNLSHTYILENKQLQTKDPNPLQLNPRPQGYRIRLTSVAAFSDIL